MAPVDMVDTWPVGSALCGTKPDQQKERDSDADSEMIKNSQRVPLSPVMENGEHSQENEEATAVVGVKRRLEYAAGALGTCDAYGKKKPKADAHIIPVKMDKTTVEWVDHYKRLLKNDGQPEGSRHDFIREVLDHFARERGLEPLPQSHKVVS